MEKINNLENYNILGSEIMETNNRVNKTFEILRELVACYPDAKKNFANEFGKAMKKIISGVRRYIKGISMLKYYLL